MSKEEKFIEAQYRGRGTVLDWVKGIISHPATLAMLATTGLVGVGTVGYNSFKGGKSGDNGAFVKPIDNDRGSVDSSGGSNLPLPERVACPPPRTIEKIVYKDRIVKVPKIVYRDKIVPVEKIIRVPVDKIVPVEKIVYKTIPISCEASLLEARSICQGQLKLLSKTCHEKIDQVLDARKPVARKRRSTRRVKDPELVALACNYGIGWDYSSDRRSLLKKHCNRSGR